MCINFAFVHEANDIEHYFGRGLVKASEIPAFKSDRITFTHECVTATWSNSENRLEFDLRVFTFNHPNPEYKSRAFNIRYETMQKPPWTNLYKQFRCLIFASGFWEPLKEGNRVRSWHYFKQSGTPLVFAGLFQPEEGCAIITKPANRTVGDIHSRMPVCLSKDTLRTWLQHEDPVAGKELCRMANPEKLEVSERPLPSNQATLDLGFN